MLRSTTTSAITNVNKRLTPGTLAENLTVKRKYKTNQEGVSKKWWFVIRGDKHNLKILEKKMVKSCYSNWLEDGASILV